MLRLGLILVLSLHMPGAVVIDRIAVIVGKHAIKASDIDRDLRITDFLNRETLDLASDAKRKSAERLIDQSIIRDEIATGDYDRASDADTNAMLAQIRRDRYGGSDARMHLDLAKYGITEDELRQKLLWQLTVLKFIDERFRPGVMVADQDVRTYYDQHLAELKKQYPRDNSFAALESNVRTLLQNQEVDKQFDAWLDDARKSQRIEYREEALK
jgi:peptidyl-prolyl cis-trans isomerase SurA